MLTIFYKYCWWYYYCYLCWRYCSTLSMINFSICGGNRVGFSTWIGSTRHCRLGVESGLLISVLHKNQLVSFECSNNCAVIDVNGSFFVQNLFLYLYKSTVRPWMGYCYHLWAFARNCYLDILSKLQKQVSITVGPMLCASLERLAHR